jgi:hypothetical protein
MTRLVAFGVAMVLTFLATASSALPLSKYKKAQFGHTGAFNDYLNGVGNGYVWANAELQARNSPLLFCQSDMELTQGNFVTLFLVEVERPSSGKAWDKDAPIELVLLTALEQTFPCK